MKFINFVKYRDLDKIASARPAHFAYAEPWNADAIAEAIIETFSR